jgi:hypothetical protein
MQLQQLARGNASTPQQQAGSDIGFALSTLLLRGAGKAGLLKDKEADRAKAVTSAQARAQSVLKSTPEELRETDSFKAGIQERRILVDELEAVGETAAADTVRGQIITLREQEQKFAKLAGETRKVELANELDELKLRDTRSGFEQRDETTRLLAKMGTLDTSDPTQAMEFDVLTKRLDKLTTITGTTEFDIPFDKVTVRAVDKNLQGTVAALDGFQEAQRQFSPEFLTLGGKIKNFALRTADIAGLDLPEDVKAGLREFTTFKQVTSTNLNAYIKAITGAQMSNPEAIRLRQDVPTFDDSPEQYQAKLENVTRRLGAVRLRALKALGEQGDPDKFRQIIRQIMATPLGEFMDAAGNAEQSDQARQASDALGRIQAMLDQSQQEPSQ